MLLKSSIRCKSVLINEKRLRSDVRKNDLKSLNTVYSKLSASIKAIETIKSRTRPVSDLDILNLSQTINKETQNKLIKRVKNDYNRLRTMKSERYLNLIKYSDFNETAFKSINQYPLFGPDLINDYKDIYSESDCNLLKEKLYTFKKVDGVKLHYPTVRPILNLSQNEQQYLHLIDYKVKEVEKLGFQRFYDYQNYMLRQGTCLHDMLNDHLKGTSYDKVKIKGDKRTVLAWISLKNILHEIKTPLLLECDVWHENLNYKGRFDCIAEYNDTIYLIEWKLCAKRKDNFKDLYDYPIQLAAYLGAFLNDSKYAKLRNYYNIKHVMLVIAYLDGSMPSIHCFNFQQVIFNWVQWLSRYQQFFINMKNYSEKYL